MKLPFTWAELSAADKEWLEKVPAQAVWDFVKTLHKLERIPFDDPYYAPSGADFMREYGDRLRAFVCEHPFGFEPTPEEWEKLNRRAGTIEGAREMMAEGRQRAEQELAPFLPYDEDTPEAIPLAIIRRQQAETLAAAKHYREHQSAQDKKIAELEATVAKCTEERDAALKARDEMLKLYADQQAKRGK